MALSPEKLASIINYNSKTLCNENAQSALNKLSKNTNVDGYDIDPNTYSDKWDNFSFVEQKTTPMYENISKERLENSKMPDAIKESMVNHPITASDTMKNFMQNYTMPDVVKETQTVPSFTNLIAEQKNPAPAPSVGIDYNYLKYIVSECIREELKKQPINEGTTLRQIGLSEGKIKLVDNKGNIYTAQLEYDGNIKDRKKK